MGRGLFASSLDAKLPELFFLPSITRPPKRALYFPFLNSAKAQDAYA